MAAETKQAASMALLMLEEIEDLLLRLTFLLAFLLLLTELILLNLITGSCTLLLCKFELKLYPLE